MAVATPTREQVLALAEKLGFSLTDEEIEVYRREFANTKFVYDRLDQLADYVPPVKYPRTPGRRPEPAENKYGAWYVKTDIKGAASGKLKGKRIALKDTVALAGVAMMDGASVLEGYTPETDATIVTRILDAGGTIVGKAVCEYFSYSGGSHTAVSGPVVNPHRAGYAAGGSSSGCAVLVATGEVDMALGGDQAGSIRIPAAWSGVVGLKPTYGLVPYSGIMSSEFTVDHTGPMTRTVADNALLLEAIAGPDGIDPRQKDATPERYTDALARGVAGLRIGVVDEGFGFANTEPDVDAGVRAAARALADLGATVASVSIPLHRQGKAIWAAIGLEGYYANMFLGGGFGTNHEGLYLPALNDRLREWPRFAARFPHSLKVRVLIADYVSRRYGGHYYGKAMNLARRLRAAYDSALAEHDLLLMPTAPMKAQPLPPADSPIALQIERTSEQSTNTAPFNITHHPALSLPCGISAGLPIGMMLIAKPFAESTLYRAAHAFEQAADGRRR